MKNAIKYFMEASFNYNGHISAVIHQYKSKFDITEMINKKSNDKYFGFYLLMTRYNIFNYIIIIIIIIIIFITVIIFIFICYTYFTKRKWNFLIYI